MTVPEVIQKSREFLENRGVDSARLESEWLLGHVLGLKRLQLYLSFERTLTDDEANQMRALVKRRGTREPLQHILGTAQFCGLEIEVNREVLIPRPETEQLAERGWVFLNSVDGAGTFLDFGTGSGCIAIALCQFSPKSRGVASDKSAAALAVARRNALRVKVQDRVEFIESDGFEKLPDRKFDLIISNPPYIPTAEIDLLQVEVRDHDPRSALDGGQDGLSFYRQLAEDGASYLNAGGRLMCEFGDGQEALIAELLRGRGWRDVTVEKDLSGRPRMIFAERV